MQKSYNFSIKHIVSAIDKEFIEAIKVYANTTPAMLLTNTNELVDWINFNGNESFIPMQFALKIDRDVVGYALIAYIKSTKIVTLDYIAIQSNYRLNTVFLAFVNLLQSYVRSNYVCTHFIVQISNKNNGQEIDKDSVLFKKLLCLEGFRKINYKYLHAPFDYNAPETIYDAFLFIQSNDIIQSILRETFLQIVESIKIYHYEWAAKIYSGKTDLENYKKILDDWYSKIEKINTETKSAVTTIDCPLMNEIAQPTHGYIPTVKEKKKSILFILLAILFFILPLPIIVIYDKILNKFDIPISTVSTIIGATISAGIAAVIGFLLHYKSRKKL